MNYLCIHSINPIQYFYQFINKNLSILLIETFFFKFISVCQWFIIKLISFYCQSSIEIRYKKRKILIKKTVFLFDKYRT